MSPSLTQPHSLWALVLLLVSNLLLWENVAASEPTCLMVNGRCQVTVGVLYDRARIMSEYLSIIATEAYRDFMKLYGDTHGFQGSYPFCHSTSICTPFTKRETERIEPKILLNKMIGILRSWNAPLENLVAVQETFSGSDEDLLSKTRELEEKVRGLQEGIHTIFTKANPGAVERRYNAQWRKESCLKSNREDIRLKAAYNLYYCMQADSKKISTFVKVLRCRENPNKCKGSSSAPRN